VAETVVENGKTLNLRKIFIYFDVDASWGKEVNESSLNNVGYKLVVLPRYADKYFPDPLLAGNSELKWDYVNDYAFLKFDGPTPPIEKVPIAFPMSPSHVLKLANVDCFVCGFPGQLTEEEFKEKVTSTTDLKILYESIRNKSHGFEHKIISLSRCTYAAHDRLISHQCPTLGGVSGGLFGTIEHDGIMFSGIHVGGFTILENNYAVPVSLPAFVVDYMKNVATEDFKGSYKTQLEPYLAYYETLVKNTIPLFEANGKSNSNVN